VPPADFDIHSPSPDEGHEAIRLAVIEAISDLGSNTEGLSENFWLVDSLFELVSVALATVDDLSARVAALESAAQPSGFAKSNRR
jgi:hypothetical protein